MDFVVARRKKRNLLIKASPSFGLGFMEFIPSLELININYPPLLYDGAQTQKSPHLLSLLPPLAIPETLQSKTDLQNKKVI